MAKAATNKQLQESILGEGGIQNTHFFNGRILTAEDLETEQNANRQHHEQLGQAIGTGIVNGLEVDLVADGSNGEPPIVSVKAGLAINRKGQAVALSKDVEVALERQLEPLPVEAGLFRDCSPPKTGAIPSNKGAYILVATPTSGFREQAPKRGFDNGKVIGCGNRYAVEGVMFRLEELKVAELTKLSQDTRDAVLELMTKSDIASMSKLRNWLAHICFGTEEMNELLRDPFARIAGKSPYTSYGVIDALHNSGELTDCDMPLALLYWMPAGVQFLDMWSVRRPLTPICSENAFASLIDEQRLAVRQAMFLQFQDQIADLAPPKSTLGTKTAQTYFRYLPSVGIIPIAEEINATDTQATRFFTGMTYRSPVFINAARLEALLRESQGYPPIDAQSGEMVWLYRVRENQMAIDFANTASVSQPYLVFASGHLSYIGDAQFDLGHYDYANYALVR